MWFQGQWEDEESGLHYNRFRYYDPEATQYLSPNPIGLAGGVRPQGSVADPNGWVDPLGLAACNRQFDTRAEAFTEIQRRAKIEPGTKPDKTWTVGDNPKRLGRKGYLYSEDKGSHGVYRQYETPNGSRVIAEHQRDGASHFHAGQPKGDPTRSSVDFGSGGSTKTAERYSQIDGSHHFYYEPANPDG
ncbi:RHS repeat-associated core domain-containing protein [Aestuariibius insulae]|uniref:RHS repeat-associated core domain-containing protein n=1 Tax=Aestuariibius insulae TaxID=2058287 RepID=UPI00345E3DAA